MDGVRFAELNTVVLVGERASTAIVEFLFGFLGTAYSQYILALLTETSPWRISLHLARLL